MKNLTWQNPEQLFVAQELINKVKSKCCGIKEVLNLLDKRQENIEQLTKHISSISGSIVELQKLESTLNKIVNK